MTSADVMWQDGSVECNIRSNDLFPVHHLDNNEFCPGDFVVDKRGSVAPGGWLLRPRRAGDWARALGQETPLCRHLALLGTGEYFLASCDLARDERVLSAAVVDSRWVAGGTTRAALLAACPPLVP